MLAIITIIVKNILLNHTMLSLLIRIVAYLFNHIVYINVHNKLNTVYRTVHNIT